MGTTTQMNLQPSFSPTGLTGQYLKSAELQFGSGQGNTRVNEPIVVLHFNDEGAKMFEQLTSDNIAGRSLYSSTAK